MNGQFLPGFMCYGIPIGTQAYVKYQLSLKVQEVAGEAEQIVKVLEGEGQAIWTVARSSTATKLDYHLALCYPSDMLEAAEEMDKILVSMVESAADLSIPMQDEGRGVEHCPGTNITRLRNKSYQNWMMRMPVRLEGTEGPNQIVNGKQTAKRMYAHTSTRNECQTVKHQFVNTV